MSIGTRGAPFDLAEYMEGRGQPRIGGDGAPVEGSAEVGMEGYASARREAIQFLNQYHQEAMLDPVGRRAELERAIGQAVMAVRVGSRAGTHRLRQDLMDWIIGAGPLQKYLDDPEVTEVMVNGREVYTERNGRLQQELPLSSKEEAFLLAERMAQRCGVRFQSSRSIVDFAWLDGGRVHLTHPVLSSKGVTITIRKPDRSRPLDLNHLIEYGMLTREIGDFCLRAIRARLNIIISGETGAGKTTVLRALMHEALAPNPLERLLVIEDTEELNLKHPHTIPFHAYTGREKDAQAGLGVDVQELTKSSKRSRPDRVSLGEVRGGEAMDLLDLAQSEVGGVTSTIHIKHPEALVSRLFFIAKRNGFDMSMSEMRAWIFETINLVIHCQRDRSGHRHVSRVVELVDNRFADLWRWNAATGEHERVGEASPEMAALISAEG